MGVKDLLKKKIEFTSKCLLIYKVIIPINLNYKLECTRIIPRISQ